MSSRVVTQNMVVSAPSSTICWGGARRPPSIMTVTLPAPSAVKEGETEKTGYRATPSPRGDIVPPATRSKMMRAVGQRGTEPEMVVRSILRSLGVSYRVNCRSLPGSPDISNRKRGWAVFVNGCFWHGHRNCSKTKGGSSFRVPEGNRRYWAEKFEQNRRRDATKCRELRSLGLRVAIVWECEFSCPGRLEDRLVRLTKVGGYR